MAEGDKAKTPDELAREADLAKQRVADAEKADREADQQAAIAREHANDDQQMADTLYGLFAGAGRPGGDPMASGPDEDSFDRNFGRQMVRQQQRQDARDARERANWARRAIAYGLTLAGTAMLVAGVAGAGNAPAAGPQASIPPAVTATPGPSGVANRPPVVGPIKANLIPTNTFYNVDASDPEGDKLTYTWTKSNPTTWEECDGNDFVHQKSFTVTLDNARTHKTSQIDVQVGSEVEDALTRLFNELKFHNQREEAKAKRFQEGCV